MNERKIFALGFFDGVHLGHQALLAQCCRLASEGNCRAAAVTFDVPPSTLLQNLQPNMINTGDDRVALLRQYGMEEVVVYETTRQTLSMPWQDFLRGLEDRGAAGFVCGEDYRFGRKGEGSAQILQEFCRGKGLPCVVVPEQTMDGKKISSTHIRTLLEKGELEQANRLLGHPHILTGEVVSGKQLGRTIGIPTANLHLPEGLLIPRFGVYACKVTVEGTEYIAVTNIGTRPTVGGENVTVEAFLLDFNGDLYGKTLALAFHKFLRPEKKFSSLPELQKEILKNTQQTRNFFEKSE